MAKKYAPRADWSWRAIDYFQRLGGRRQKFYYRCGKCRRRKVLSRELWEYKSPPKCCRGVYWTLDMDRYRAQQEKTGAYAVCGCGNNSWGAGHKPGSTMACAQSKATLAEREAAWNEGSYY